VQVNRNGLRAIASGAGNNEWLELRFVGDTADIRVDDILVSSGLGQRFPAGYPVGRVLSVEQDPSQPFADVKVAPTAQLTRSRYMLLVFSAESGYGELVPALEEGSELNDAEVQAVEDALQDPVLSAPPAPEAATDTLSAPLGASPSEAPAVEGAQ
jgi:rod shape-determining protein MreC